MLLIKPINISFGFYLLPNIMYAEAPAPLTEAETAIRLRKGAQHVRLMPYQVWCIFGIYAFDTDVRMREYVDGEQLLPSEYVVTEKQ